MIRIQKQLVIHEDCEFGYGTVTQARTENNSIVEKDYTKINAGNIPAIDIVGIESTIQNVLDYLMANNITNFSFANETGNATIRFKVAEPEELSDAVNLSYFESAFQQHLADLNPHKVTKAQVGLRYVDNTPDADKPLSYAAINEFATKLDKSHGNDRTNPHNVTAVQAGALPITGGNVRGRLTVEGSEVVDMSNIEAIVTEIVERLNNG